MKRLILISFLTLFSTLWAIAQDSQLLEKDLIYRSDNDYMRERCILDILTPDKSGKLPVIVWFHGGGLTGGNKYFPNKLLNAKAVLVAANYRLSPRVEVKDCIDDAAAAVAWVKKHIAEYGGDPERIILSGHSAGGYLVSMVGMDKSYLAAYGMDADEIAALFPFSGHTITHFTERKSRDIPGTQPIIDQMAPIFFVRADAPPLYLMTGDRDLELLGRYEENAYMWRMMQVVGHKECKLFEFDGHDHGAMVDPGCHVLLKYLEENFKED